DDRFPPTAKRPRPQADYAEDSEVDYDDPRYVRAEGRADGYADPRQPNDGPHDREDDAGYEPEYDEDRYAAEFDEPAYAGPSRGRRWLYVSGVAVIGLLVMGGAGVYGYRALLGK